MRDIHNGHAARLQPANGAEQVLHFAFRQCAGGLVHNEHFGICGQRFHNFYHLLVLHREGLYFFLHGKSSADGIYQFLRTAVHGGPVHKAVHLCAFIAQKNIFCNCKVRKQIKFLMDDGDACLARLHGVFEVNRLALIQDGAAIVVIYASQNTHQGGFSSSVFTY